MTKENLKKKAKHLKGLVEGKVKTGNSTRDALIKSDAERNLKELISKFPELEQEAKPKPKEVKPKSKKEK